MPVHEAVAMILVVTLFFGSVWGITNSVLSHRRKMAQLKLHGGHSELENHELRETVALLQDRLTVLETIATDPARRTSEEIERLR